MWIKKPFFEYATAVLLIVIILFFIGKIDYAFWPFKIIIATVFAPILIAGLLYYLIRPFLQILLRYMPKVGGIAVVFFVFFVGLTAVLYYFGPTIKEQVASLAELAPQTVEQVTVESEEKVDGFEFAGISGYEIKNRVLTYMENASKTLMDNVMTILGTLMNVAVVLIVVPFILFFLLKDDHKLIPYLMKYVSEEHKPEGRKLLADVDETLSNYIVSQAIVAVVVGFFMFIGYVIIGLDYALSLAVFAMFLIIVPFLGPLIGVIPALFVALMSGEPFMAIKVLIVLLIVQQLEGNLVTPNIMGSRLNIHPLTIIFLLLIAAALYGFVGILIAIPLYAVLKTIIHNFRLFIRLRKKREVTSKGH